MLIALKKRVEERWDNETSGLLKYLSNSATLKEKKVEKIFKVPTRSALESFAMKLIKRLFPSPEISVDKFDNEVEVALENQDEKKLSFEEQVKAKMNKFVTPKPVDLTTSQALKTLRKEMDIYEATNEKSPNLKYLFEALKQISPTSVASERAFSCSGSIVTKKRSCLDDGTINDLCFLQGVFKNK